MKLSSSILHTLERTITLIPSHRCRRRMYRFRSCSVLH